MASKKKKYTGKRRKATSGAPPSSSVLAELEESHEVEWRRFETSSAEDREHFFAKGRKMSEVLLEYAEPLLEELDDFDERKEAMGLAILCWNLSLMPFFERMRAETALMRILRERTGEGPDPSVLVARMTHRKRRLYPELTNVILEYRFTRRAGGENLAIVSMPGRRPPGRLRRAAGTVLKAAFMVLVVPIGLCMMLIGSLAGGLWRRLRRKAA
jgi:hypothetical protein